MLQWNPAKKRYSTRVCAREGSVFHMCGRFIGHFVQLASKVIFILDWLHNKPAVSVIDCIEKDLVHCSDDCSIRNYQRLIEMVLFVTLVRFASVFPILHRMHTPGAVVVANTARHRHRVHLRGLSDVVRSIAGQFFENLRWLRVGKKAALHYRLYSSSAAFHNVRFLISALTPPSRIHSATHAERNIQTTVTMLDP